MKFLQHFLAVRHRLIHGGENNVAVFVLETERQDFRAERADLARREVDDTKHLPADKAFQRIVNGDLRRGFLEADLGTEIDDDLERRLARFGKGRSLDDGAGANIDALEIGIGDGLGLDRIPI